MASKKEIAVVQSMDIEQVKGGIEKMASYGTADLAVKEKVDEIAIVVKTAKDASKELKEIEKSAVDQFKRMAKPYNDDGQNVTCYSWDAGIKMRCAVQGGGAEINEQVLLDMLYARYGEVPGDTSGRAWKAFCAVTDPVEVPRKLNEDKLHDVLVKAERVKAGLESGEVLMDADTVKAATEFKSPIIKFTCTKVTKAESSAHEKGELNDVMVFK